VQELHRQKEPLRVAHALHAEIENSADVAVRDLAGALDLATEPLELDGVLGVMRDQHLQRHVDTQTTIDRLVHLAGPADTDEADDPVARRHRLPDGEHGWPFTGLVRDVAWIRHDRGFSPMTPVPSTPGASRA
jgi:hypothetical protein